ncbi:hypothetical protein ACHAW6_007618 [Cyclotella cf. meneghiniana]
MVFMTMVTIKGQLFLTKLGDSQSLPAGATIKSSHSIQSTPITSNHTQSSHATEQNSFMCTMILDNESSLDVEAFITKSNASFQYTPPDIHQTNIAKYAIHTWKNRFDTMHASAAKSYCLSNWCKNLEQTDITFNMMHPCTQNPNLSSSKALKGAFLFNAMPMAPIGTECMIHTKPACCHTWGYHAIKASYFSPSLNHYHCMKAVTDTGAVRIADTYTFLHHTLITNADCIPKLIKYLEHNINGHFSHATR